MYDYTVILTQAEDQALSYVALSQNDWIQHAAHERCRVAIDEIVQICVAKCLETGTPIPGTKDEMVTLSFSKGWVKPLADVQPEPPPAIEI